MMSVSNAYQLFMKEAPLQSEAWMKTAKALDEASSLEKKTEALAYIAVLAAARLVSGIPFHVLHAKELGATRAEVISAILVGLPAVGNCVTQSLPAALEAFDGE